MMLFTQEDGWHLIYKCFNVSVLNSDAWCEYEQWNWTAALFVQCGPLVVTHDIALNFSKTDFRKKIIFVPLHSVLCGNFKHIWTYHSVKRILWFLSLNNEVITKTAYAFRVTTKHVTQSSQFTNTAYPHYQHMEVLFNPYLWRAKWS